MKKFRDGGYNTLVSTCVGEEGLDIGEVDLIICYDSQKSPIRLIQRMGRTGRKREGRIIILLTEGKEENAYKCSLSQKKNIYKIISNGQKNFQFFKDNPLMIPKGLQPKCHKLFIEVPVEIEQTKEDKKAKKKKGASDPDESTVVSKTTAAAKKTKITNFTKLNINLDDDFSTQLPDLDFNVDSNSFNDENPRDSKNSVAKQPAKKKTATRKAAAKSSKNPNETQLKLFQDCNFLNLAKKSTSRANTDSLIVSKPPMTRNLTRFLAKKDSLNADDLSKINLAECIQLWQTDEDDFITIGANESSDSTHFDKQTNLNESLVLKDKFSTFYSQLIDGLTLSDEEEDNEVEEDKEEAYEVNDTIDVDMVFEKSHDLQPKNFNVKSGEENLEDLFSDDETEAKPELAAEKIVLTSMQNGKDETGFPMYPSQSQNCNQVSKLQGLFADDEDEDDILLANIVESASTKAPIIIPDTMDIGVYDFSANSKCEPFKTPTDPPSRRLAEKTNKLEAINEEDSKLQNPLLKSIKNFDIDLHSGLFSDDEDDCKENEVIYVLIVS